jgi:hypothetical protein
MASMLPSYRFHPLSPRHIDRAATFKPAAMSTPSNGSGAASRGSAGGRCRRSRPADATERASFGDNLGALTSQSTIGVFLKLLYQSTECK